MLPYGTTGDGTPVVATPAAEGLAGGVACRQTSVSSPIHPTPPARSKSGCVLTPALALRSASRREAAPSRFWSSDGRELVYLEGNRFMSVKTTTDGAFTFSSPTFLFELSLRMAHSPRSTTWPRTAAILALKAGPNQVTPSTS